MSHTTAPTHFTIPDLFTICPLKMGYSNPYYKEASAASRAWVNGYDVFTDRKRAFFVQGCNELLVSRTYPYAGYEQFRTCCDFVNLLFVIDEISDDQNGKDAKKTGETYLNVMRNPNCDDQSILANMTRDFRARLASVVDKANFRRFLVHSKDYIEAVTREAELREEGKVLDLASYTPLRRENSAVRLCFGLFEYCLGLDLPDEVFEDPVFISLYRAAMDMVCWSNDVYSFNMEQAKGHTGNNIVTVLMQEKNIDIQAASDYVGVYFAELMTRFVTDKKRLPSWGASVDANVALYVSAMEHWVSGNLQWSFETPRYFGSAHEEVKHTRLVILRPRDEPETKD